MNRSFTEHAALILVIFLFCTCAAVAQYGDWKETGDWRSSWNTEVFESSDWDQAPSAEISGTSEDYFPSSIMENSGILIEDSGSIQYSRASYPADTSGLLAVVPEGNQNRFWIVSRDGSIYWHAVNMPKYRYARMLLIPSSTGPLVLEKRDPNGYVRYYTLGNVRAQNQYRIWFYADASGTYQMRYRIGNGPYSNVLTFYVSEISSVPPSTPSSTRPNIQITTQAVDPATNRVYYSYNQEGRQIFRIKVLVIGPEKYKVRSVHYQLHPTFSPSEYTSTNPSSNFELELWTWGAFNMPITITTMDYQVYMYNYYFTFGDQLRDAQQRGVPFIRVQ
jgi:hypothetical protein